MATIDEQPRLPARVTPAEDVVWQRVDGQVVLFVAGSDRYFGLDGVGSDMWELLQQEPDVSAAHRHLLEIYDVDEPALRRDLALFVTRLAERGLLRVEA